MLDIERKKHGAHATAQELEILIAALIRGIATFELSKYDLGYGPLGPVIAASAIGLTGYEIFERLERSELPIPRFFPETAEASE